MLNEVKKIIAWIRHGFGRLAEGIAAPLRRLGLTRDSPLLKVSVIGGAFAFLSSLPSPAQWGWTQYMQIGTFLFTTLAAQLGVSRLDGRKDAGAIDPARFRTYRSTSPAVPGAATPTRSSSAHEPADVSVVVK